MMPALVAGVAGTLVLGLVLAGCGTGEKASGASGGSNGSATRVRYQFATPPVGYHEVDGSEFNETGYCLRYQPAGTGIECETAAGMSRVDYEGTKDVPWPGVGPMPLSGPDAMSKSNWTIQTIQYPGQNLDAYLPQIEAPVTSVPMPPCGGCGSTPAPPETSSSDGDVQQRTIAGRPAALKKFGSYFSAFWLPQNDVVVSVDAQDPDLTVDEFANLIATLQPVNLPSPHLLPIWEQGVAPVGAAFDQPASAAYDVARHCVVRFGATDCTTFAGEGAIRFGTDTPEYPLDVLAETDPGVATVRVTFADGKETTVTPTHFAGLGESGYVLAGTNAVPNGVRTVTGLDAGGHVVGVTKLPPSASTTLPEEVGR